MKIICNITISAVFGKKTVSEIKTKLLVYGYEKLNSDERKSFWCDFVERNHIA